VSYLIYCVLKGRRGPARPSLRGVGRQAVWVLECGALCIAVSEAASAAERASDLAALQLEVGQLGAAQMDDLVAYAKVVEAYHRVETVVPMRYGCRFGSIAEIRAWIAGRDAELCGLLGRLEGCVEMGVRILLGGTRATGGVAPAAEPPVQPPAATSAGAAYLAARRSELAWQDRQDDRLQCAAQAVRTELGGLARECVVENRGSDHGAMVSLYFLVERAALPGFRAAFGRLGCALDAAALLSGPWPPYNFVCPSAAAVAPRLGGAPPQGARCP
jgi:hypothetical protein